MSYPRKVYHTFDGVRVTPYYQYAEGSDPIPIQVFLPDKVPLRTKPYYDRKEQLRRRIHEALGRATTTQRSVTAAMHDLSDVARDADLAIEKLVPWLELCYSRVSEIQRRHRQEKIRANARRTCYYTVATIVFGILTVFAGAVIPTVLLGGVGSILVAFLKSITAVSLGILTVFFLSLTVVAFKQASACCDAATNEERKS